METKIKCGFKSIKQKDRLSKISQSVRKLNGKVVRDSPSDETATGIQTPKFDDQPYISEHSYCIRSTEVWREGRRVVELGVLADVLSACQQCGVSLQLAHAESIVTYGLGGLIKTQHICPHQAAYRGHIGHLHRHLTSGMTLNVLDEEDYTPLIIATLAGNLDQVRALLNSGADINYCSRISGTALHVACSQGHLPIVDALLHGGADTSVKGPSNQTCLFLAASKGQLEVIKVLAQHSLHSDETDVKGLTPLHAAVSYGHTETALYLIRNGACVCKKDSKGNLPLHYAVKQKNVRVSKALIRAGSNMDLMNNRWESPLHLAICAGHIPTIWLLAGLGCNVNQCKPDGSGVLHQLVWISNSTDTTEFRLILETLLLKGLDMNTMAYNTLETPLYQAIGLQTHDIAEILMAYGADPNLSCPFDLTCQELACRNQRTQTVQMILHCGVDWRRERWLNQTQDLMVESHNLHSEILKWKNKQVSLQNLCRICIRKHYSHKLFSMLESLRGLPLSAKNFIMLADIIQKPVMESVVQNISKWYSEADEILALDRNSPTQKNSDLLEEVVYEDEMNHIQSSLF